MFGQISDHYGWTETHPEGRAALAGHIGVVVVRAGALPEGGSLSTRAVLKDASDVKPIPDPTLQRACELVNQSPR